MHILISNDDGVYAEGINVLAKALRDIAKVTVIAPDRNRSGASNSLTLTAPLRCKQLSSGVISVEGTPTDCAHLALTGLLDEMPDMVVSGINQHANMGDDVWYSGTVAAAMEGRFLGYPALAVSLDGEVHYQTAADVVCQLIQEMHSNPLPASTILNVNVPDIPFSELQGFEITRLGTRHVSAPAIKAEDPRGAPVYWIGPPGERADAGQGTDFYAVEQGRVSLTPLRVDITHYEAFENLSSWVKDMSL